MSNMNDLNIMTAESMGKDLLGALVTEIKLLKKPWEKMSQNQQDELIERLRKRVVDQVAQAVHILAADGRVVCEGDLDQVTIKDGVKAVVKLSSNQPDIHELFDATGKKVLLVVADAAPNLKDMTDIKGESDQRAMDLGNEYDPNGDGKGMPDDGDVVDAEFTEAPALAAPTPEFEGNNAEEDPAYDMAVTIVCNEKNTTPAYLAERLSIDGGRAFRLLERMQREGIISEPDANGARIVYGRSDRRPQIDAE